MNLSDITITPNGIAIAIPKEPFRGKIIYLYDPRTGTTIGKSMSTPSDAHLGAIEDM